MYRHNSSHPFKGVSAARSERCNCSELRRGAAKVKKASALLALQWEETCTLKDSSPRHCVDTDLRVENMSGEPA